MVATSAGDSPMLELKGIYRHFGSTVAVEGIDLSVEQGEFLTLLGPSGSGKSTTLYMIAGFDAPTAGDIRMRGNSVLGMTPNERNVGMVFQRYSLFPHMSVRDNIGFPLSVRKVAKRESTRKVDEILNLVQLAQFADRKPSALSGGQQQRVALARALVYEPQILLMDEPLSALDRKLREELQQQIRALHERINTTIIYVTHDQEEALHLSDRIAVFNQGRITQIGSGEQLYGQPNDSFVASFIGASTFTVAKVDALEADHARLAVSGSNNGISVPRTNAMVEGAHVLFMVRPEQLSLSNRAPNGDAENVLRVSVREAIFLGDSMSYRVENEDGLEFRVKVIDTTQSQVRANDSQPHYLSWSIANTHVFDDWSDKEIQPQSA